MYSFEGRLEGQSSKTSGLTRGSMAKSRASEVSKPSVTLSRTSRSHGPSIGSERESELIGLERMEMEPLKRASSVRPRPDPRTSKASHKYSLSDKASLWEEEEASELDQDDLAVHALAGKTQSEEILKDMESFISLLDGESPTDITPEAGKYLWNLLLPGWIFRTYREKGRDAIDESNLLRHVSSLCCSKNLDIDFTDDLQFITISRYEDEFRRKGTSGSPITLQDVKDVALFTALIDIPKVFIKFFHRPAVDKFLRSLLVYMQYFLQVWDGLMRRRVEREKKLWHPKTDQVGRNWCQKLDLLRYVLARDYTALVIGHAGERRSKLSASINSYRSDKLVFELLFVFSVRVVEIGLYERANSLLKEEMERILRPPHKNKKFNRVKYLEGLTELERRVLESPFSHRRVVCRSPLLRELRRPHREMPFVGGEDCINKLGTVPIRDNGSRIFRLVQYAYMLSEPDLATANIRVGILGFRRGMFDPILSGQQNKTKFDEAQIQLGGGTSLDDPESRVPDPIYIVPKKNPSLPYNFAVPIKHPPQVEDRSDFWIGNSKLRNRCFSEFIFGLKSRT